MTNNQEQSGKNVIVAVSGGVDSAVAAFICRQKGFNVTGVTLFLHRRGNGPDGSNVEENASVVCRKLGIEHIIINAEDLFEQKVLRTSWDCYNTGRTPNPCTICNRHIKFGVLLDYARQKNADLLVTGHHTQIVRTEHYITIRKGDDPNKDQSYFLYDLTPEQLQKIYMPIGEMTKEEVRKTAVEAGLDFSGCKESQDTCFAVQGENFAESLRKQFCGTARTGNFVSPDGRILGRHKGIHNYTIGQRRGLGIALGAPAFVVDINEKSGDIVVSTKEELLFSETCRVKDVNWLIPPALLIEEQKRKSSGESFICDVKVRYRTRPVEAEVFVKEGSIEKIVFSEPQRAVTSGQAAVLYTGNLLIGGGVII